MDQMRKQEPMIGYLNRLNFVLAILLSVSVLVIHGQKWDNTFGTSGNTETFSDLLESYDKGYLLSGSYKIPTSSCWLIKTDINGNMLWDKVISHSEYEFFKGAIDQNSSGEIAVGRTLKLSQNNNWPSLVKLGPCGNKLWCRTFVDDDFMWGWFNDVVLLENGDVIGLANMEAEDNGHDDIWLYYIDSAGDLLWKKSYTSTSTTYPYDMPRSGNSLNRFGDLWIITGDGYYPHPSNPSTGYLRPLFIGIDTAFNEMWYLPFGVEDWVVGDAESTIQISDSVLMSVGTLWEDGDANTIMAFINLAGEELGFSQILNEELGQNIELNGTKSVVGLNDSLYVVSVNYCTEDSDCITGEVIVDSSGHVYTLINRPYVFGYAILIKTFDKKLVLGATSKIGNNKDLYLYKINDSLQMDTVYPGSYTYDSLCPTQIQSGIIDISNCLIITDVGETPTLEEYFAGLNTIHIKALPNPTNTGSIKLQYSNTEHHKNIELRCFNIHGEEVHSERIYQHQGESLIEVDRWPKGMYLAIVYSDNRPVGQVKFVVR